MVVGSFEFGSKRLDCSRRMQFALGGLAGLASFLSPPQSQTDGELNRRRHKPGSDLIETRPSLVDGRRREVYLTHKGWALVHTLIHEMRRGPKGT